MTSTNRERILDALRLSSQPLDDDELSRRTGITPRQSVNQTCRALATAGLVRRVPGPDEKIVNILTRGGESAAAVRSVAERAPAELVSPVPGKTVVIAEPAELPPGRSGEQRAAERVMLDVLAVRLGVRLDPARLTVPSGARVEIDGADLERTVLVECWAHQGKPKAAQRHKVLSDALKLTWIGSTIYPRPQLILCLSDPIAAAPFLRTTRTWAACALTDLDIGIEVVELPEDIRLGILAAQERRYR
ncbi:MAG: hypothetical protein DLM58_12930 [Pseudonocardiales bacterium]|nr:MAG: hypothetical protein DLM58_12930 [Pseudonocardiales bacterium]